MQTFSPAQHTIFNYFEKTYEILGNIGYIISFSRQLNKPPAIKAKDLLTDLIKSRNSDFVLLTKNTGLNLSSHTMQKEVQEDAEFLQNLYDLIIKETQEIEEQVTNTDPGLAIYGILGSATGALSAALNWKDEDKEKKPYIEGFKQIIENYDIDIPENIKTHFKSLAGYESQKIGNDNSAEIAQLLDKIKANFC